MNPDGVAVTVAVNRGQEVTGRLLRFAFDLGLYWYAAGDSNPEPAD